MGDIFDKVYVLTAGDSVAELQHKGDLLAEKLDKDLEAEFLSAGFVPSMIFPGQDRRQKNFAAWKQFWTHGKVEDLKRDIGKLSTSIGFAADAFAPFYKMLKTDNEPAASAVIPVNI